MWQSVTWTQGKMMSSSRHIPNQVCGNQRHGHQARLCPPHSLSKIRYVAIRDMDTRQDDVLLTAYPKSGIWQSETWTQGKMMSSSRHIPNQVCGNQRHGHKSRRCPPHGISQIRYVAIRDMDTSQDDVLPHGLSQIRYMAIRDMDTRQDDVLLTAYPKSGIWQSVTWTQVKMMSSSRPIPNQVCGNQ